MNFQELPSEIIQYIYLFLYSNDKTRLLQTSWYLLDCCPSRYYLHRIKFRQSLEKIKSIIYKINICEIYKRGECFGSAMIYQLESEVDNKPIPIEYSYREFENYATITSYYGHTCLCQDGVVVADEVDIRSFAIKQNGKIIKLINKNDNPIRTVYAYGHKKIKLIAD